MKPARLHRSHQRLSQYCRRDVISPNPTVQPRYHGKSQIITKERAPQKTIPNAVYQSQLSTSPVCPGCLAAHNCQSSSAQVPPTSPTSPPHQPTSPTSPPTPLRSQRLVCLNAGSARCTSPKYLQYIQHSQDFLFLHFAHIWHSSSASPTIL